MRPPLRGSGRRLTVVTADTSLLLPFAKQKRFAVTKASVNSSGITMARAIERYFNVALYLLVLTAFGALASAAGLDLPAVVMVGSFLVLRGFELLTGREFQIPERWTTVLTAIYISFYAADYFFLSRGFLGA